MAQVVFTSASQNLPATAQLNQIQADNWQSAGVPYVVVGQLKPIAGNSFEVHYQLYDVQKTSILTQRSFNRTKFTSSPSGSHDQ
ncbi:hypothetical protein ACSFV5_05680 [Acinetobacter sp. HC8-3S]